MRQDGRVGEIILLALGSAVFPALLACVAILISRPEPRRLLLAFYVGGLGISVACGLIGVKLFHDGKRVAGNTASTPHPVYSIAGGLVGLLLAWLLFSGRGRDAMDRWRARHPRRRPPKDADKPSWVERHLSEASVRVAFFVGVAINLPGPFYILALGDIAKGGYPASVQVALILVFNAIMFIMLEVPLVGYLINPEATAARVSRFGHWLNSNGMRIIGALVGLFSVSLLVQGFSAL